MIEIVNLIIGILIVVINLIPLLMKKYKLLLLTSILSLFLILLLKIGVLNF
jgi:hypothetical protein